MHGGEALLHVLHVQMRNMDFKSRPSFRDLQVSKDKKHESVETNARASKRVALHTQRLLGDS